jgi:hypothetical protein
MPANKRILKVAVPPPDTRCDMRVSEWSQLDVARRCMRVKLLVQRLPT